MEKKNDFMFGAFILAISGFFVKLVGAIFRIPLTNLVGPSVMGYYSSAYEIYIVLLSVATSGLPTGIAVLVSRANALEKYSDIKKIMRLAGTIFISLGAVLSILGLIFARPLAVMMNSEEAYYCMFFIMPAVFFISVVALFKGYFQGFNNMAPTAISNAIEAVFKLIIGYSIALWMHNNGYPPEQVVGGAILGVTLSTVLAMIFMTLKYAFRGSKYRFTADQLAVKATSSPLIIKEFFVTVFPLMISSITSNVMSALDAFLVMNNLKGYLAEDVAKLYWGSYSNMAITIFNLPSFLIVSIGTALVPGIAAAFAKNNISELKNSYNKALKITMILSFACTFGMNAVAEPLLRLFFTDVEGIAIAKGLLEIMAFILISVGLTNITAAVLNSVKKAHFAVITVIIGAFIKSLFTWILVSIPELNIYGAPIATNIAYPIMAIINILLIKKFVGILPNFIDVLLKPLLAGAGCYIFAKFFAFVFGFMNSRFEVIFIIICTAILYLGLIILLKLVSIDEIKSILKGRGK